MAVLDETVIKSTTGGDTISARFLYREFFEFRPQWKTWLVSNHLPMIRGDDLGILASHPPRIQLSKPVPFDRLDPKLREKLNTELPGIPELGHRWRSGVVRARASATRDGENRYHRVPGGDGRPGRLPGLLLHYRVGPSRDRCRPARRLPEVHGHHRLLAALAR